MDNVIIKIAALPIKNRKLLLVRSKNQSAFLTLGGKIESGESDLECLKREVREEIDCEIESPYYFQTFQGKAHNSNKQVKLICYFVTLIGNPKANSEIMELHWWNSYSRIELSNMLKTCLLPALKNQLD